MSSFQVWDILRLKWNRCYKIKNHFGSDYRKHWRITMAKKRRKTERQKVRCSGRKDHRVGRIHKIETCFDRAEKMKPCPDRRCRGLLQGMPYGTVQARRQKCGRRGKGRMRSDPPYRCSEEFPQDDSSRDSRTFRPCKRHGLYPACGRKRRSKGFQDH